jgi:SAM-dependent methyltransferase
VNATPAATRACWCGNAALDTFDDDYGHCSACETLVRLNVPPDIDLVRSEDDFYGRDYWFRHQTDDLGAFDLAERARRDLPERCAHWTAALLRRTATPGDALDVGCGHGGFVALLEHLGFRARGLELSPAVVEFARSTFQIRIDVGRIEDAADIAPASLDLVALMDVVEHLPNPLVTMRRAVEVLRSDGLVLVQTPRYPEGATRAGLEANDDLFLRMLVPEHVYLFSRSSLERLLRDVGLQTAEFEAPVAVHDMLAFATRTSVPASDPEEVERLLGSSPSARLVAAILDAKALDADELTVLRADNMSVRASMKASEAYAIDLRAALDRMEADALRHAAAQDGVIAARDAEIEMLKARVAERETS